MNRLSPYAIGLLSFSALAYPAMSLAQEATTSALAEVVVTAERRAVNMQDVPIAVTAITEELATAAGVRNVTDLQVMAPAVNWGTGVGGANISIRGISGTGSSGDESANSVYVDGVYNPVGASLLFGLNNIESIEIDKGPQGTLFGRNASGGAIQIRTRDPQQDLMADVSVGYSSHETVDAQAYVTGGVTDSLAADLAIYYSGQGEGWGRNVTTGSDAYFGHSLGVRTKWRWTPDDLTTVTAIYSYNDLRPIVQNGPGQVIPGENRPYFGFYNGSSNVDPEQRARQYNGSVTVQRDLGFAKLSNILAYDYVDQPLMIDLDYGPAPTSQTLPGLKTYGRTLTEELQLQSQPDSKVAWTVGLYYLRSTNFRRSILRIPPGVQINNSRMPAESYSVYGQATMPVFGDRTRLTLGARYTTEEREFEAFQVLNGNVIFRTAPGEHRVDERVTWRVSLDHDLTEDILIYASATRGFKSGFYNISVPTNAAVEPQDVTAYEVGFKSQFFDNRVRLNASAFFNEFENIQSRSNTPTGPVFNNAAGGEIRGLDVDLEARPVAALRLQGGLTLLDSEFTEYANAPYFIVNPAGGIGPLPLARCPNGAGTSGCNAAGNRLVRSPEVVFSLGGQYEWDLGDSGALAAALNFYYNDGFFFDAQNRVPQPQYEIVNASLTWRPNDAVSVMLWGKNLTESEYYNQIDITTGTGDVGMPAPPRTYGVTVRYRLD